MEETSLINGLKKLQQPKLPKPPKPLVLMRIKESPVKLPPLTFFILIKEMLATENLDVVKKDGNLK